MFIFYFFHDLFTFKGQDFLIQMSVISILSDITNPLSSLHIFSSIRFVDKLFAGVNNKYLVADATLF
jgi:hypothetical protein